MLVGWSMSDEPHPGVCGVSRIYDWQDSDLATAVNTHRVKRIGLTSKDDTTNPAEVVRRIRDVLRRFPGLEVDYAHENEVDRADHRADDIPRWAAEHKAIQDAIHAAFPADGSQGKVKTAIDLTAYATRELGVGRRMLVELQRIGALPDVLAASMYPAGRKDSPATESPMADHIDIFVDLAAEFGIRYVSCWEIGTPSPPNMTGPPWSPNGSEGSATTPRPRASSPATSSTGTKRRPTGGSKTRSSTTGPQPRHRARRRGLSSPPEQHQTILEKAVR
jgi:hypothetical protein